MGLGWEIIPITPIIKSVSKRKTVKSPQTVVDKSFLLEIVQTVGQQRAVTQNVMGWQYSEAVKWKRRQVCSWRQRMSPGRAPKLRRMADQ